MSETHIVGETSPKRYFVEGFDSDDEESPEPASSDKVTELARKFLENPEEGHSLYVDVAFREPKGERNLRHQRITCRGWEFDPHTSRISFLFFDRALSSFFSAGYQKRWSKIACFYEGRLAPGGPQKLLDERAFLETEEGDEYHFTSLDLRLAVKLSHLSDPQRESLGLFTSNPGCHLSCAPTCQIDRFSSLPF